MNAPSSLLTIVLTSVALGAVLAALVNGMFMALAAARQRRQDTAVRETERAHQLAMKQLELQHQRAMKALELRQQRMTTALELARFKHEQLLEAGRNTPRSIITVWDPRRRAVGLSGRARRD